MVDIIPPDREYIAKVNADQLSLERSEAKAKALKDREAIDSMTANLEAQYRASIEVKEQPSIWSIAWFIITNSPKLLVLIYQFLKVITMNEDKKTTVMATAKIVCGIIALGLSIFHIDLSAGMQETLVGLAGSGYLVFSWLQGLFTNKKTEAK
jgi:hypothetical protein